VYLMLALILIACPILPMLTQAELARERETIVRQSLVKEKAAVLLTFVGTHAVSAEQAAELLDLIPIGTERRDLAQALFPSVVDKDNWSFTLVGSALPARLVAPSWLTPRAEFIFIDASGDYLEVRPAPGLFPVMCLQLERMSASAFAVFKQTIGADSNHRARWQRLQRSLRNWLFTSAQVNELLSLMAYRDETTEAGLLLRPRVVDPSAWNTAVCAKTKGFDDCRL